MISKSLLSNEVQIFFNVKKNIQLRGNYVDVNQDLCFRQYTPPGAAYWSSVYGKNQVLPSIPQVTPPKYLRENQKKAFSQFNGVRAGMIKAETGSGKSWLLKAFAETWKGKTLILCHNIELTKQQKKIIDEFDSEKKCGIYFGQKKQLENITVVCYNSFQKNPEKFQDFDQILVDECDKVLARKLSIIVMKHPAIRKIGVTATTTRSEYDTTKLITSKKRKIVIKRTDDPKYVSSVLRFWGYCVEMEGLSDGYALKNVFWKPTKNNYSQFIEKKFRKDPFGNGVIELEPGVIRPNDWIKYREKLQESEELFLEKMKFLSENISQGDSVISFFDRVEECEKALEWLRGNSDKNFHLLYGGTKQKERDRIKKEVTENGGVLICHPTLTGRGWDLPRLKKAFILFPLASSEATTQLVGRVARYYGGEDGEVYDLNIKGLGGQFKQRMVVYKELGLKINRIK